MAASVCSDALQSLKTLSKVKKKQILETYGWTVRVIKENHIKIQGVMVIKNKIYKKAKFLRYKSSKINIIIVEVKN